MREISYGNYERSVFLPDTVDVEKAKASFKKGMLWVTFPKKPECAKNIVLLMLKKPVK
jgi:HSP20 family protein